MKEETNYEKVLRLIKEMDEKDKLRTAIRMCESSVSIIDFNKEEMLKKFDNQLKEIDKEYRTTILNWRKFFIVNFTMSYYTYLSNEEQNQIALYLFNNIKLTNK